MSYDKYPVAVWIGRPLLRRAWFASVQLFDIPVEYYPRCQRVAVSRDRQKAIDKAVRLRREALRNYEGGKRQDEPMEVVEVEVTPPAKRGPVWR